MDHIGLIETVAETLWRQQNRRRFGREPKRTWEDLALVEKQIFRKAAKVSCSTILKIVLEPDRDMIKEGERALARNEFDVYRAWHAMLLASPLNADQTHNPNMTVKTADRSRMR